jgi:hypothetical protein
MFPSLIHLVLVEPTCGRGSPRLRSSRVGAPWGRDSPHRQPRPVDGQFGTQWRDNDGDIHPLGHFGNDLTIAGVGERAIEATVGSDHIIITGSHVNDDAIPTILHALRRIWRISFPHPRVAASWKVAWNSVDSIPRTSHDPTRRRHATGELGRQNLPAVVQFGIDPGGATSGRYSPGNGVGGAPTIRTSESSVPSFTNWIGVPTGTTTTDPDRTSTFSGGSPKRSVAAPSRATNTSS